MTLTSIDKKSTLAKLLATENIEVQQNKVRTLVLMLRIEC